MVFECPFEPKLLNDSMNMHLQLREPFAAG